MTAARFADLVQEFFPLDTWFDQASAERAVRSKAKPHQQGLTAAGILATARRAGWVEDNTATKEFCIPARCWMPTKKRCTA